MTRPNSMLSNSVLTLSLLLASLLLSTGCDEDLVIENQPPSASVTAYCTKDAHTYLVVNVEDYESDPTHLALVWSDRPEGAAQMPTGPSGDGLTGLTSARAGEGFEHLIEWAAAEDGADPCADHPEGVEPLPACAVRPATPPETITVVAYAWDENEAQTEQEPVTLTLDTVCPR